MARLQSYLKSEYLASHASAEFCGFIKKITEAKSKAVNLLVVSIYRAFQLTFPLAQEEHSYITDELENLSAKMGLPDVSPTKMKDYLIRLIHCFILGYDVDFGIIYAIMMTQSGETPAQRRVGYLVCSLFLERNHELGIMLINSLQRDLKSENYLDKCAALNAICYLDHPETEANVLGATIAAMNYPKQIVRKKAVFALLWLWQRSEALQDRIEPLLKDALNDKDPSVVFAALSAWKVILTEHGDQYRGLLPLFMQVHRMIMSDHLHRSFMYHGVMAPWAQITCLQIYEIYVELGIGSQEQLYQLTLDSLSAVERKVDAAYAIVLQCVKLLSSMDVSVTKENNPFRVLDSFLASPNHNMKYLGLVGVGYVDKGLWTDEWPDRSLITEVVSSAGDDDVLIYKVLNEALDILDKSMTESLLRSMGSTTLSVLSNVAHIKSLAAARKNLNSAYVEIQCGQLKQFLLQEVSDTVLRKQAVDTFYELLKKCHTDQYHSCLLQLAFWVLGDYTYLSSVVSDLDAMRQLQKWVAIMEDEYLQVCGLQAIKQCMLRSKSWLPALKKILLNYRLSPVLEKQQIAHELLALIEDKEFEEELEDVDVLPLMKSQSISANSNRPLVGRYLDEDDNRRVYPRQTLRGITEVHTYPARGLNEYSMDEPTLFMKTDIPRRTEHSTRKLTVATSSRSHVSRQNLGPQIVGGSRSLKEGRKKRDEESMLSSLIALELDEGIEDDSLEEQNTMSHLDTNTFGALWLEYNYEHRLNLGSSFRSMAPGSLASYLSKSWGIQVVEIIGNELIAYVPSGGLDEPVLVYAAFQGRVPEITIRASSDAKLKNFTRGINRQ
ncbi:hypothetical protein EC973_006248 [Apophysomyces ossiformis]|uniref:AP-4 complex subunit epsilon-1 C-terminal domain-containing protein n=1 Tax=Apophysomyces ossiformis TaxID=679940 RepID=A0A8H7BR95_9FUNG|nr:hypothetical protein EC973_006248 [Apophysomyces ossiformis]